MKVIKMLLSCIIAAGILWMPVNADAAEQKPDDLFRSVSLTVFDYERPAASIAAGAQPGSDVFLAEDGTQLGHISGGPLLFAASGYERSAQGLLDGFNDTRNVNRIALPADFTYTPAVVEQEIFAHEVIRLANAEREKAGLPPLVVDDRMMEVAAIRVRELPVLFDHRRPDGSFITALGYGENLSYDRKTPAIAIERWMDSPSHRANILRHGVQYAGAACCQAEDGTLYWTMLFAYQETSKPHC